MNIRFSSIVAVALVVAFQFSCVVESYAGPPLATDDAGTVNVGKVEVELNGSYSHDSKTTNGSETVTKVTSGEMKITTGIYKDLGVSLVVPYVFNGRERVDGVLASDNNGWRDMVLEVKYRFLELGGIGFAIKPKVIMPSGRYANGLSEGRWQFGTTLIATREFMDGRYTLHANLGYEHHDYRTEETRTGARADIWSGSLAGEAKLIDRLTAVADFGVKTTADRSTRELTAYSIVGARYEISSYLDVNAGVKVGLTAPEDDVTALYGIVLKF